MNIQQTIRKVLKEEVDRKLINMVVRRLSDIDELILESMTWTSLYYKERFLKEKGIEWFIDNVIDGFYIDNISPIFENWDEGELEPEMIITDDEEEELREFFKTMYYDKIAEYYKNNIEK
jgi:hypothetical protein